MIEHAYFIYLCMKHLNVANVARSIFITRMNDDDDAEDCFSFFFTFACTFQISQEMQTASTNKPFRDSSAKWLLNKWRNAKKKQQFFSKSNTKQPRENKQRRNSILKLTGSKMKRVKHSSKVNKRHKRKGEQEKWAILKYRLCILLISTHECEWKWQTGTYTHWKNVNNEQRLR